ncbi:MAG: hypothetical protein ACRDD1_13195, partial [Planctomycetia bacterium]
FLASSLQLALWRLATADPDDWYDVFPGPWYALLILMTATLAGSVRGWTDVGPLAKLTIAYHAERWHGKPYDRLPAPTGDDDPRRP